MNPQRHTDDDMRGVKAALLRAAKRARDLARQTGTSIVVMRDGKLVHEVPPPDHQDQTTARST
jgi:hypothetical protein